MALVRERERGTLEQLLVSPLEPRGPHAGQARAVSVHRNGDGGGSFS